MVPYYDMRRVRKNEKNEKMRRWEDEKQRRKGEDQKITKTNRAVTSMGVRIEQEKTTITLPSSQSTVRDLCQDIFALGSSFWRRKRLWCARCEESPFLLRSVHNQIRHSWFPIYMENGCIRKDMNEVFVYNLILDIGSSCMHIYIENV